MQNQEERLEGADICLSILLALAIWLWIAIR